MAKGQQKSNREKKKPKQDKKKGTPPSASPFPSSGPRGNPAQKSGSKKRRWRFSVRAGKRLLRRRS